MSAIDKARMLRRRQEESLEFHVEPLPKLGGKLAAIDRVAVDEFHRELGLWMERFMEQIKRVRAEDQGGMAQSTTAAAPVLPRPVAATRSSVVLTPAPSVFTADSEEITADSEEVSADQM